jgi:Secretion system C-terminal sorting domain
MKTHKITTLTALLIMLWNLGQAQVNYIYDANGNRISRNTVMLMAQSADSLPDSLGIHQIEDYLKLQSDYKEQLGEQTIYIYPNPTQGAFAVQITNMAAVKNRKMLLTGMNGREISRKENFNELTEFDLSNYESGTYILRILLGDKQTTWKIVKQ